MMSERMTKDAQQLRMMANYFRSTNRQREIAARVLTATAELLEGVAQAEEGTASEEDWAAFCEALNSTWEDAVELLPKPFWTERLNISPTPPSQNKGGGGG